MIAVRGEQKNQKTDKPRKPEKKITEKTEPIKFLKKPAALVRFRFYKQKTKKTEPNRNETDKKSEKKPSQTKKTEPNRKKPSQN